MYVRMCIDQIKCYFLFGYWENVWKLAKYSDFNKLRSSFSIKKNLKIKKLRLFFREGSKSSVQMREWERAYGFPGDEFWGLEGSGESHWGNQGRKVVLVLVSFGSVALAERRRFGGRIRNGKCRGKTGHFWRESSARQVRILLYTWKIKNGKFTKRKTSLFEILELTSSTTVPKK